MKDSKMKYTCLCISLFFSIPVGLCHADTKAGAIKDAEFVIEKQKKNTVNQEQRLFFKAPMRTAKSLNKPLATIKTLMLEDIVFDPAAEMYLPFRLEAQGNTLFYNHYCRLGIGSLLLPYLEIALDNYPFGKAIWSTNLAFVPALWNKKSTEASIALQGKFGVGSWLLQPALSYQHAWYKYSDTTAHTCRLHQGKGNLLVKQATESSTQDGQVRLGLLNYHDKKINEQLLILTYRWRKQLDNWSVKVTSYNDIADYTNDKTQQARLIFSATPSVYLTLPKAIQFKTGLRMAYHNDPIPGKIPSFDLYPMFKVSCGAATWFAPYIGIKGMGVGGSVVPLHLQDIVAKNPFIASNEKLSHRYQYFKLYGGSKAVVAPHLAYHLRIVYRQLKHQYRVVAGPDQQISLKYNPGDCNVLKATGLVDYSIPNTLLHTTIKGSYCRYMDNGPEPIWWYHKPRYKLKQTLTYRLHEKVLLNGKLHLHGPTIIKDIEGIATELRRVIHLSLGIDYLISERFTAFLMVNNLLNRKHMAYTGYPDKKINFTGGLQYRW